MRAQVIRQDRKFNTPYKIACWYKKARRWRYGTSQEDHQLAKDFSDEFLDIDPNYSGPPRNKYDIPSNYRRWTYDDRVKKDTYDYQDSLRGALDNDPEFFKQAQTFLIKRTLNRLRYMPISSLLKRSNSEVSINDNPLRRNTTTERVR